MTIKPAMTAEEWTAKDVTRGYTRVQLVEGALTIDDPATEETYLHREPDAFHAIAALCLDGQPFGFTREDVANLRVVWTFLVGMVKGHGAEQRIAGLESLIGRIEALLPPEEK